jgi:hypothetical protein
MIAQGRGGRIIGKAARPAPFASLTMVWTVSVQARVLARASRDKHL